MKVKLTFRTVFSKTLFLDLSLVGIISNDIFIKGILFNSFTPKELNLMANTSGFTMEFYEDRNMLRLYVPKGYCLFELMPSNEDRIKYLTNEIDKMSTELNNLIK